MYFKPNNEFATSRLTIFKDILQRLPCSVRKSFSKISRGCFTMTEWLLTMLWASFPGRKGHCHAGVTFQFSNSAPPPRGVIKASSFEEVIKMAENNPSIQEGIKAWLGSLSKYFRVQVALLWRGTIVVHSLDLKYTRFFGRRHCASPGTFLTKFVDARVTSLIHSFYFNFFFTRTFSTTLMFHKPESCH